MFLYRTQSSANRRTEDLMLSGRSFIKIRNRIGPKTDPWDFIKAIDKVAHEKLLLKLHHYGITGDTLKWIKGFLKYRKQAVVINCINSEKKPSLLQHFTGLCSRPNLFLAYTNDLPEQVKSRVRLFADDTALYLTISSPTESESCKQTKHASNNGKIHL